MRALAFALSFAVAIVQADAFSAAHPAVQDKSKDAPDKAAKAPASEGAADFTRSKLLKATVTGKFENVCLGEILKDFGDQVDAKCDRPIMWVYGDGFPFSQKVTFSCNDKALEVVLDQLLKKAGNGLGYYVVSKEGDKYDGWVRLTTTGERGTEKAGTTPPKANDEATAAERLSIAKKLIERGMSAAAKPLLEALVNNFPKTKAGSEAKELLEKLEK